MIIETIRAARMMRCHQCPPAPRDDAPIVRAVTRTDAFHAR